MNEIPDEPTLEASDEGLEITRVFDAPIERVWREWTTPEAFADWYGGEEGEIALDTVDMDVREGGEWSLQMKVPAENVVIDWRGTYKEVHEPERLAFTVTDQPGDEFDLVEVDLEDLGDGRTLMRLKQSGGSMPEAGYRRAGEGWGGFFDRMSARLS
jgi:uncharacterized protein YndB with AHSA1/START domain